MSKKKTKKIKAVCPKCGKTHPLPKNLGVKAEPEELNSLIMINNRVNVANQATQPTNIPPNITKEQVKLFVDAALEAKVEAMDLQRQWWKEILVKYTDLPKDKNVFVDFETGEFYVMEMSV